MEQTSDKPEKFAERAARIFGSLSTNTGPQDKITRQHNLSPNDRKFQKQSVCRRKHFSRHSSHLSTPDYLKHPERWIKYDLKQDGTEKLHGMTAEQQNKAAAFEFLREVRKSDEDKITNETEYDTTKKVVFKKPAGLKQGVRNIKGTQCSHLPISPQLSDKQVKLSDSDHKCNVHVMPEYQVGAKREKKLKRAHPGPLADSVITEKKQKTATAQVPAIRLSHLEDI